MNFAHFAGIIIRGPNLSEKYRHLCRWDEHIRRNPSQNAANKLSHSHPQFPRSTLGTPGFLHRFFPVFRNVNLRTPGVWDVVFLAAVTMFQGKLASLQQVSSPNNQDNFQICCADMYLVRFLANFAGFRLFLWISRDFADLLEIRGSATARNIRSPDYYYYFFFTTGLWRTNMKLNRN